jgi:hypothetical protein
MFSDEGDEGLHSAKSESTSNENKSLACEKNGQERQGQKLYSDSMVIPDIE